MDNMTWGAVAPALHKNGYLPVPILPNQKRPPIKNWREFRYRNADATKYTGHGCGILCGEVRCIDIDIRNEQVSSLVEQLAMQSLGIAGRAPRRIGAWPKVLILVRSEPGKKITSRPYLLESDTFDNDPHKVEILGEGQQAVCYGIHPSTGRPYTWNGAGDPMTVPVDALPYVSDKALRAFVVEAEAIMAEYGRPCGTLGRDDNGSVHVPSEDLRANVELISDALSHIPNDALSRDDWVLMAHAIKGACGDAGKDLFVRWSRSSSKSGKSGSTNTPERVWDSCKPTHIGAGTVFFEAARHGWTRPAPEPPDQDEIPLEAYWDDPGMVARARQKPVQGGATLISAAAFLAKQRPADWLVHGIVQRGSLYACTAPTNHGKTAVMLVLVLCLAAGRKFCGVDVTRCRVAILCGENQDGFRARLRATMSAMDIDDDDIAGNLYIYDAAAPLGVVLGPVMDSMAVIGEFGAVLIDTSTAYFGGDKEDDNVQALVHARLMRELCEAPGRPAVIANAHPPKHTADRESCIPRGGSAFLNEIDTNLSVWVDGGTCSLHWTRKKRGPDFEPIAFEFVSAAVMDCGISVPTVVARWVDDAREEALRRDLNAKESLLLRTMRSYPKGSLATWAQHGGFVGPDGKARKSTIQRMLARLEGFKLVGRNRYGWFLTKAGEAEAQS